MTSTPAAGTYIVLFSSNGQLGSNAQTGLYGISISGSGGVIASTERSYSPRNNSQIQVLSTQAIVTVDGSEDIEIYYRVTGSTFTVYDRSLVLIQVS